MTELDRPTTRRPAAPTVLTDAVRRLSGTVERATRDRPHQAKNGTLIVGARSTDIDAVLAVVTAVFPDAADPGPLDLREGVPHEVRNV